MVLRSSGLWHTGLKKRDDAPLHFTKAVNKVSKQREILAPSRDYFSRTQFILLNIFNVSYCVANQTDSWTPTSAEP